MLLSISPSLFADDINSLRKNFLYAEAAIQKGNIAEYNRLKGGLQDYPLYPYLEYAVIARNMRYSLPEKAVADFLNRYPGSVLANRLQREWLRTLAKQQQWALYQQFYTPSPDVGLQCNAIFAEYKTSQDISVLEQASPLWTQGQSQPDDCNALFNAFQKSPYFTPETAWQRAELAVKNKQRKLVTYLKRYLPLHQQQLLDTWLAVDKKPSLVTSSTLFKSKDPFAQVIQIEAMKQLIRQDSDKAKDTWATLSKQYSFTETQHGEITYAFAIASATGHEEHPLLWLNSVPSAQADTAIHEWRVRYALRRLDWENVSAQIARMPQDLQNQPLWRYWQARALLAQNQQTQANQLLSTLAKERHYHGMLASDLLKIPYTLNDSPYHVSEDTKRTVANNAGIQRATELYALKRVIEARREWDTTVATFDEASLQAAAQMAHAMQWYDRGILTAAKATHRDDLTVRFPLAYAADIQKHAQKNQIPAAYAFAIARQESAFVPDARSSANALGLMQLLPSTAKLVAPSIGQSFKESDLLIPAKNIAYGTAFLKQMSAKFNHNAIFATAAYNAGPSRIPRWQADHTLPADVWIETIPFRETRNYVQNVYSYQVIYQHHLGQETKRLNHAFIDIN
jgi:soluble lytic murein transglycosylase